MANYQLPISAYVGAFAPSHSLTETLETALNSRKHSSRVKPEHARKYFFSSFARQVAADTPLQSLAQLLVQAARDQKLLLRLGVKSWSYGLESYLLSQSEFRLAFLRWFHAQEVLQVFRRQCSRALLHQGRAIQKHAKKLELREAVKALHVTSQQAS